MAWNKLQKNHKDLGVGLKWRRKTGRGEALRWIETEGVETAHNKRQFKYISHFHHISQVKSSELFCYKSTL